MKNCPNINDREYKLLSTIVGDAKAHTIYDKNNGNPVSLNADGTPSSLYKDIVERYGESKAIKFRAKMFTNEYERLSSNVKMDGRLNEDGSFTVLPGFSISVDPVNPKPRSIQRQQLRNEYVQTEQKVNGLIQIMQSAVPGVKINKKSFNDVKGTPHINERSWVDKTGINVNTQSIHFSTPIHELTHLWIHYLENTDSEKHALFMSMVKESIKDNKELYDTVRRNYPNNNDVQLLNEYAAVVSGITSENDVRSYLNANNKYVSDERVKSLYGRISNAIKVFFDALSNAISKLAHSGRTELSSIDFRTATMQDVFDALKTDILTGNKIINMGTEEMALFLDNHYQNDFYEAEVINTNNIKTIEKVSDITPILINNDDMSIVDNNQFDNTEYVKNLVESIDSRWIDNKAGKLYTYSYSKRYEVDDTLSTKERQNYIRENIIPTMAKMVNSFNDNIKNVINTFLIDKDTPLEDIIKNVFKSYNLSDIKIKEIHSALSHLGFKEPISFVLNYNELKDDSQFSYLYKESIAGYNPLIIFHGYDKDMIDISIIDLASGILGREDNILSSRQVNLASRFGRPNKEFSYRNTKADIRKVIISTTLAGMNYLAKEKGVRLRVRKTGVIGFNGNKVRPYMNKSLQEAFGNARSLFRLPELTENMNRSSSDYAWFNDMINDDAAWDHNSIAQSWKNILESYYTTFYMETGMSEEERDKHINGIGSWTHYGIIRNRLRKLQQRADWINNPEHQMLSMYSLHFKRNISVTDGQNKDIDGAFKKVTNVHNIKSDILQHVSIEFEGAKNLVVEQVNKHKDKFTQLLEKSLKSRGQSLHLMGNKPERVFGHLFKVGKITLNEDYKEHKKGDVIEVKLWNQLYGSYDLKEAKAAGLTAEDIALSDYILSTIRERYIKGILHQEELYSKARTKEEVEAYVDEILLQGTIPVMPSTSTELARKGKVGQAVSKVIDGIAYNEYAVDDITSGDYKELHSKFTGQMSFDKQLKTMGIMVNNVIGAKTRKDNEYASFDMKAYENQTSNLEFLFTVFVHDSIRAIEFDKHVIPAYNDAKQFIHILKSQYGSAENSKILEHTEDFLEQYYQRTVDRKNKDQKNATTAFVRTAISLYSFVSLGYRPTVWMRSGYFNVQNSMIESLASLASSINTEEAKKLNFPGPADMTKANALMVTDFKKIYELGKKYSIINSSEMEVIDSFFTTNIDKSPFKTQIAHIGNYYTDVASRLITMVGFMVHDGSYDAHGYTEEDGLTYDVTKDKRFYKDGDWKSENAKKIHEDIKNQMLYYGQLEEGEKMTTGYDFEEVNTRMKWYSDKYIIGSMDEYQKILLGNTWTGQLFTQFRTYLPDKVFNWFGSERKTYYGGTRTTRLNEDGEVEVIKEQIMIEGSMASLWHLFKDVVQVAKMKDKSWDDIKNVFENTDPMVKYNMANLIARAALFAGILSTLKLLYDQGMSDRDRDKLEWLYGDLMILQSLEDLKSSAMPISGLIDNIMSIATGEAAWTRVMKYTGPVNDTIWYYELLTGNDNVLKNYQYRKEKSEEEKQKAAIRQEIIDSRKKDNEEE